MHLKCRDSIINGSGRAGRKVGGLLASPNVPGFPSRQTGLHRPCPDCQHLPTSNDLRLRPVSGRNIKTEGAVSISTHLVFLRPITRRIFVSASLHRTTLATFDRSSRAAIHQPPKRSPTYLTRKSFPLCHRLSCPWNHPATTFAPFAPQHHPRSLFVPRSLLFSFSLADPRSASTTLTPEPVVVLRAVQRTHP